MALPVGLRRRCQSPGRGLCSRGGHSRGGHSGPGRSLTALPSAAAAGAASPAAAAALRMAQGQRGGCPRPHRQPRPLPGPFPAAPQRRRLGAEVYPRPSPPAAKGSGVPATPADCCRAAPAAARPPGAAAAGARGPQRGARSPVPSERGPQPGALSAVPAARCPQPGPRSRSRASRLRSAVRESRGLRQPAPAPGLGCAAPCRARLGCAGLCRAVHTGTRGL